jgi:hypothetical protein
MPGLTGAVKNKLTDLLNSRRQSVQQTLNQQLWESGTILAVDDAGLQERISIVRRMLNEISSADLSEATHIAYISYRNRGITRIQQNIDFDKYDRIKKWVSGETPLADDMNYIFPRIKHVDDMLQPLRNDFGNSWNIPGMVEYPDGNPDKLTHIKFYGPFVELLGKVLEHLTGNVSPQIQERLGEINSQISKTIRTLNRISWCMDMVDYNVVTDGAINLLAETLKNNCTPRMMLTDQFTPMVLEDSVGAYRETPRQAYIFRPLPDSRLHNYSQYLPEVGLISEYSMQVKHQRFGYGKHLYSQSLFPGEEVTIEMSTKSKREIEVTTNSSEKVFEDATSETSTDFNQELNNEFSKTTDKSNKDSFSASATLSASYLGASVSGSVSTSSESSNQVNEFAKGMENTTDKLATKLSDQRQVTFEQSTTSKETLSEENEQKTTRKFVNINKERTLTFNFFQITREYLNTLYLDDISFYYTSGKYRIAAIFVPIGFDPDKLTDAPDNEGYQQLKSVLTSLAGEGETWDSLVDRKVVRRIPGEVADAFPQNALAILFHPPYHETMPLAVTNAFIASTFDKEENAVFDINHSIWRFLGNGTVSPEGLGISAFPKPEGELKQWPETEGAPSPYTTIFRSDKKVVADRIKVIGVAKKPYEYNLANIDICYSKVRHFRARYVDEGARNTLPLPVFRKTYVINTEGVYCENMLGQCGALEQFATDHRRLDVDAKRIANEQARLMTPPDIQHYTDSDGNTDFGLYGKAVEQYERIVKANRPEAVPATTPTGTESSN